MISSLVLAAFAALLMPAVVTCFAMRDGSELRGDSLIALLLFAVLWLGPLVLSAYLFTLAAGLR